MLQVLPPRAPIPTRLRTQLEAFLVLRRNPLELWGELAYEMDVLPGKFLGRQQMMLNAPEAIRHVLVGNTDNYRRNPATRRVLQPVLGQGLFLAEGDAWRHQRRTIAPALAPRTMPILAHHVVAASAAKEDELDRLTHRPLELLPEDVPSITDRRRAGFRTEWLAFLDRLIEVRRGMGAQPGAQDDRPRDLFDLLAGARDPETGAGFDHAQLRDEVSTMILAGHETTAVTLFWSLYLAALYPDQQDLLAAEAASVELGPDHAAASLAQMPNMRAHIDESLRLYPPAFLIVRQAVQADTIMGHSVSAGTTITISPWVIHRHRARWHAPDAFDSGRFLPGATPPERYAYMPFGAGPRICVGAQFALTEATLVLARLLRRFRVGFAGTGAVVPRGIVTTQPDRPVRFVIARR